MAAVEVTITGVLYDKTARTTRPVVLIGDASLTGLEIGGGPMPPGQGGGGGGEGIWGPTDPRPSPPIANVPGGPVHPDRPPGIWGGGNVPMPNPPIYLPPDITPPEPPTGGGEKPPPDGAAGWGYYDARWGYFPAPGEAQPK